MYKTAKKVKSTIFPIFACGGQLSQLGRVVSLLSCPPHAKIGKIMLLTFFCGFVH